MSSITPSISIKDFPDVVLVNIFQNLSIGEKVKAELVSKRWKYLSRVSWKYLTEVDFGFIIGQHYNLEAENLALRLLDRMRGGPNNNSILRRVVFGQHVYRWKLDGTRWKLRSNCLRDPPSPRLFQALADHCPKLVEVDIRGLEVSKMLLPLSECTNVKKFYLDVSCIDSGKNEEVLSTLVQNWRRLQCLDTESSPGIFLRHVSSSLISLRLRDKCQFNGFSHENVERIISNCFRLESLTFAVTHAFTTALLPIRHLAFLKHLDMGIACIMTPEITSIFHGKLDLVSLAMPFLQTEIGTENGIKIGGAQYFEILSLLPALRHFGITPTEDTWDDFIKKWLNSDAEIIGLRRKDAPLNLRLCLGLHQSGVMFGNHYPEIPWTFQIE